MRSPLANMLTEPRLERMLAFNHEREDILADVVRRVTDGKIAAARRSGDVTRGLELTLNDVCFHEDRRFRATPRLGDEDKELRGRFSRLSKGLRHMSESELERALSDLTDWYAHDVVGNFNPAVFAVATRILPVGLSLLFSPVKLGRSLADVSQLRERILIEGQVADLERLSRRATLVVVPTHLSNLDSIVVGFALERTHLPPCTYGAGKNLFTNPLMAFFMRNLGAYRVDRRIKHDLYKDVLKAYSTVLLERGYHSLFFPGGTRSRSGAIESKLKLGLAGTALEATINMMRTGGGRPIYIVPATINYHLVLEAATLIEDYLKEAGKSRYIIDDDESTRLSRVARYLSDMLRSDASMTMRFSEPLDVLGHRVSPDGVSHDDRGRPVELRPFLTSGGEVKTDAARDAEYTRELGERIAEAFQADTHVLSTHLVAYVLFRKLLGRSAGDLFHVLRGAEDSADDLPTADVLASIARVRARLAELAAARKVRLGLRVANSAPEALLDEALRFFTLFHVRPVARRTGENVAVEDRSLLYYYHNRLVSYGLEGVA
jgi:glycerol-3-phosphate O-acyltransferase